MQDFGIKLHDEDGRPLSVGAILGAMDPSELQRVAEAVRELEGVMGWDFLEALTRAHHAKAVFQMTEGHLSGIEAYAHSGGFVKGLRAVLDIRNHVIKTAAEVAEAERQITDREEKG